MVYKTRIALPCFLAVLLAAACDLPHEPGPRPTPIIETEFKPGMNILGVLRLDDSTGTSFIHVEQAGTTDEIYDWDFPRIIENANVAVRGVTDTTVYPFVFKADTLRPYTYTHPGFIPTAGEQYALSITHPGLPTLTDTTVVPVKPSIDLTTMGSSENALSFDLLTTTDTHLYEIYLFLWNGVLQQRVASKSTGRITIWFEWSSKQGQPLWLEIYGYDANLAEYMTAITTIKYQTYQETVTTVTGGYGVFGSVSRSVILVGG